MKVTGVILLLTLTVVSGQLLQVLHLLHSSDAYHHLTADEQSASSSDITSVLFIDTPGSCAGNAAFVAFAAAEAGIQAEPYRKWGLEQINYILGDNHHDGGCYSFEIGFGSKFARNPHHRASSCPNRPQPCSDANRGGSWNSPQLLNGALVGGPDQWDNYNDNREDYKMNEVAIDYNSGFHSALAAINHLKASSGLPHTNNKCAC